MKLNQDDLDVLQITTQREYKTTYCASKKDNGRELSDCPVQWLGTNWGQIQNKLKQT